MRAYTALCAHLLFPLHERLKGHDSVACRRRLERSQWCSPEEIARQQAQRLQGFMLDIGAHVPYYRELFRQRGIDARAIDSVDALRALPLLTKADIRAHTEAMKAEDHGPLKRYNTGGSSGEPLVFHVGKQRVSHDVAAKWRATRWWGVDIGDPEMVVWGSPIELGVQDRARLARDKLLRTELLPAFELSQTKLDGFVDVIRRRRPAMLFGYPSALARIARHAEQRGVAMNQLDIRVAFVTSERLYDDQRALIGRVFGCPVANGYGGRDAGFIAHECPSGGMHLSAEDIVVELLDREGCPVRDDEPGEIVVTHLATRDFPFVRYRTGDVAVRGGARCACGRGLPLLREIQGRSTDFVVASDGTVMHGLALIYVLRDLPGVTQFRIEQLSLDETRVQVVPGAGFDAAVESCIETQFRARLGPGVRVRIERVAEIPAEASGKFRYVISRVAQPATLAAIPG